MSDRDAFLAAIHDAPDDDAPRLVFADWLEERGEVERAEFIRIQIEMRREHDAHGRITPRLDTLFLQQRELFQRPWADVLRRCGAAKVSTYARGFSTREFFLPADNFAREAAELAGWFGPQSQLVLSRCRGSLAPVSRCPELRWLRTLTLVRDWDVQDYTDEDFEALCTSPFLNSIRRLHLMGRARTARDRDHQDNEGLTAAACSCLTAARSLNSLEELDLSHNPIGDEGVTVLCNSASLERLQVLNLQEAGLTARGAQTLMESSFPNLKRLNLIGNGLRGSIRSELEARFGERVQLERILRS